MDADRILSTSHAPIEKLLPDGDDHRSVTTSRHVPFRGFDPHGEVVIARRRLPHWRQIGVAYFITFRLADSVPQPLLRQWRDDELSGCDGIRRHGAQTNSANTKSDSSARMQEWLDAGMGACHMRRSDVRSQVELCLLQFDGKRYDIDAFVLMPNHVHALIKPALGYDRSTLLQGTKGVSANRCNKLLGCKSTFWMDESYDHIVRDAKEVAVFRNYIAGNPAKAGLKADEYSLQLRSILMP
jgi:REP element-mobilizing transposase RayT